MKKTAIILIILMSLLLIGCQREKDTFDFTISGENTVEVGCSTLLSCQSSIETTPVWTSSDETIAYVDHGMVIGLAVGHVVISAEINGLVKTKNIEVINNIITISIFGNNTMKLNDTQKLVATLSKEAKDNLTWTSLNPEIVSVQSDGTLKALRIGETAIVASIYGNKQSFNISVITNIVPSINIQGKNKIDVLETLSLSVSVNGLDNPPLIFSSSDETIATVSSNGEVKGISKGTCEIKVSLKSDEDIYSIFNLEVDEIVQTYIHITGSEIMEQGKHNLLSLEFSSDIASKEVTWTTSDPSIAIVDYGIVLAVNKGQVVIKATLKTNPDVFASINITVNKYKALEETTDNLNRVNQLISQMTLEQKVGQMFVVGFSGTSVSSTLTNAINTYHFGNIIYMGANVTNPSTLLNMSNTIQNKIVEINNVPAFISTDQEGGRVIRLKTGATHFVSNMGIAATSDVNNAYLEGQAVGTELLHYGINVDFAPVMDVNNNPENPVIGTRSYSDNSLMVSLYGKNMFLGLASANVMGCAKHFPGHGNTSTDSHYGLPKITTSKNELYQTELAPFISSIANGIDAIMTTHIIFSAIDTEYPATLSNKILTGLLRDEIGYDGLIITDGMEMAAVTKNFGDYDKTGVLAVKAGVDMLTFTSLNNPMKAYNGILNAVKNNEITEERINESVRRILLKKLKYGILDKYLYETSDSSFLTNNNQLSQDIAIKSLTDVYGNHQILDKNKSTLIISPTCSFDLGSGLTTNSLGSYAVKYLKEHGFTNISSIDITNKVTSTEATNVIKQANNFEQVIIAFSNVKTTKLTTSYNLVNTLAKTNASLMVIALETPYDIMMYQGVNHYYCVYGYQLKTVEAITKYLNNEFVATGKLPVKID